MRKRTKRKEWALINPITHATYQASKLTIAELNAQRQPVIVALEQLMQGNWDKNESWQPMFECLNRIESLTKLNNVDAKDYISKAQGVFVAALSRHEKTGARAFKADELATMREIVTVYSDLLQECSHRQLQEAAKHTNANVDRILKQKSGRQVAGCIVEMA